MPSGSTSGSTSGPHIDPKMLEVWQRGALTTIPLGPLATSDALALRHRLYRLRTVLRRINHPDAHLANQATIALRALDAETSMVIVYPANKVIDEALARAGITSSDPPPLE